MDFVDVSIFLPNAVTITARIQKSMSGSSFTRLVKQLFLKEHSNMKGALELTLKHHNRWVVTSTITGTKVVYCGIRLVNLASEHPWLPSRLLESNSIVIQYSFYVRVRIRGSISAKGGSTKAFLKDIEWQYGTTFEEVSREVGSEWQLFSVNDELLSEENLLGHILYSPGTTENFEPTQRQLELAAKRDPTTGVPVPPWSYPLPVVLCAPKFVNYSSTSLPVLLNAVDIPQLTYPPGEVSLKCVTRAVEGPDTEVLNSLIKHGSSLLFGAVKGLDGILERDPAKAKRFHDILNVVYSKLEWVNRGIKPENQHNVATHRLVIHEFLAATVEFIGGSTSYSVESVAS